MRIGLAKRAARVLLAATLMFPALAGAAMIRPGSVFAAISTCYVYTWIPWITGSVEAHGGGTIDCDSPDPISDEIQSILYENWGPFTWERDNDHVYLATWSPLNVVTEYVCDGHGWDDWWTKSRGRDNSGNYSYWYSSLTYNLNC